MTAQVKSRRDEVAEHIYVLVKTRAKRKGCRVKKLDQGARDSVANAAAWRLILNQQRFGNIRDYIEGGFWHEESAARDKLIERALDAERKAYTRAADHSAWGALAPYAVAFVPVKQGPLGQPLPANSLTDVIEQEESEAEAAEADAARELIEAEENEKLRLARNAYGETLPMRHRRALFLICAEPGASNSTIAARVGVRSVRGIKPETVSKIRDKLTELAEGALTRSPEALHLEALERLAAVKGAADAVRRAERRRDAWLRVMSVEEFEAARSSTFWASAAEALGMTIDGLLGATIEPKPSG